MLFLAVFCGTLAEYWLEHRIEHNREREFMESLAQDLQSDINEIDSSLALGNLVNSKADTLVKLLNDLPVKPESVPTLYRLSTESSRIFDVPFEDRTSSQLKNAGGMRLIRNRPVADSIRNYWSMIVQLQGITSRVDYTADKGGVLSAQIFHTKYFGVRDPQNPLRTPPVMPDARLITNDPSTLSQYANWKYYRRVLSLNYIKRLKEARAQAVSLIALIHEQYHLE